MGTIIGALSSLLENKWDIRIRTPIYSDIMPIYLRGHLDVSVKGNNKRTCS